MSGHAKLNTRTTRNVLFVGGIADGQWHVIASEYDRYRIPIPLPLSFASPADEPIEATRSDDYRIQPFSIFGRTVWVAIITGLRLGEDTEVAAIRALFQRDVAEQLTRGRR